MNIRLRLSFAAACLAAASAFADPGDISPALPVIPDRTFNLKDFGAVPDGRTIDTGAFKRAIAAVKQAGGGTLTVPAGVYFTGPFDLCGRLNFHLEKNARVLFSPNQEDYRRSAKQFRPLLYAHHCDDLEISGEGTIDGNGQAWWPDARKFRDDVNANPSATADAKHIKNNTSPRPSLVVLDGCHRVLVQGVTLTNSPIYNLVPMKCGDVTIDGITIFNPADAPNTDGIDPSVSNNVLIRRCTIDTGDDCIAVKAGGKNAGVMENVLITDCAFRHGHGCSIGSETFTGLRHMTVRRCTFDGTDFGVRLKSDRLRGGLVEDVVYEDLIMKNVRQAIVISSYYEDSSQISEHPVTATTPQWRNIVVRNVVATDGTKSAGMILGLPEMPAEDILLDRVRITAPRGLQIACVRNITLRDVEVTAENGPPLLIERGVSGLKHQSE